jgi:hypothetical protein
MPQLVWCIELKRVIKSEKGESEIRRQTSSYGQFKQEASECAQETYQSIQIRDE